MEAVGPLTGGIAHDVNNLLQIVIGSLEALQRHLPSDSARLNRAAQSAITGARRDAALTQRLLAFFRRQPLDPKPLDINTPGQWHVGPAATHAWRDHPDRNCARRRRVAGRGRSERAGGGNFKSRNQYPRCHAQGRATDNRNWQRAIDEAYALTHAELVPGQYVLLSVSDTVCGMDPQTLTQAFEPFFTTKPVGKGTGLGLSQVYGVVKQSGWSRKNLLGAPTRSVKVYLPRWLGEGDAVGAAAVQTIVPEGTRQRLSWFWRMTTRFEITRSNRFGNLDTECSRLVTDRLRYGYAFTDDSRTILVVRARRARRRPPAGSYKQHPPHQTDA